MSVTVRPGRQHPVLHPQVRQPVHHRVDRPVPAVDRAVVQRQLGELRRLPVVQRRRGILVVDQRQQRGEIPQVLLEQVEHRRDPSLAEPHPGPDPLDLELVRPGVGRLLEQGEPGLPPQFPPEQERGVGGDGHLRARDRLGGVPVAAERLRADLKVTLHAGAGGLGGDRVDVGEQPVGALDRDPHLLAAGGEDLLVQQPVPRVRRHGLLADVALGQRRQDADHHQVAPGLAGPAAGVVETVQHPALEQHQGVADQRPRRHVDLQVELAELTRPAGIGDRAEHLGVLHRGQAELVDEVQLDLQANLPRLGFEPRLAQHPREHIQAAAHLLSVSTPVLLTHADRRDIPAHRSPPAHLAMGSGRSPTFARHGGCGQVRNGSDQGKERS